MATATVEAPSRIIYQPGLEGTPIEACVRYSWLSTFTRSPLHLWSKYLAPDADDIASPARRLGSAVHCLILEPEAFDARYVVAPEIDKRTKAGKELAAAFEASAVGLTVLTPDEYERAREMASAVYAEPLTRMLIPHPGALVETMLIWRDEATGVVMRGTPDYLIPPCEQWSTGMILDLKTTRDASHKSFQRDAYAYHYHWQAAAYSDAVAAIWGAQPLFGWLAVESDKPHGVAFYAATAEQIALGRREYRALLPGIAECMRTGEWPGYTATFTDLGLPAWVRVKEEE